MYSLVESAKVNDLDIFKYLEYLLRELPDVDVHDENILSKYLPWSKSLPEDLIQSTDVIQKVNKDIIV